MADNFFDGTLDDWLDGMHETKPQYRGSPYPCSRNTMLKTPFNF